MQTAATTVVVLGRYGSVAVLLLLPPVAYIDIYINSLPAFTLICRLAAWLAALFLFVCLLPGFRSNYRLLLFAYHGLIAALALMSAAVLAIALPEPVYTSYIPPLLLAVLIVLVAHRGPVSYLYISIGLPMAVLTGGLVYNAASAPQIWSDFIIPYLSAVLAVVVVVFSERQRQRNFTYTQAMFSRGKELIEKNTQLEITHERIRNELNLARQIQQNFVPAGSPHVKGLRVASLFKPSHDIGGDFFDYIHFKEAHQLGIFIGDVSGHGVPPALITGMVKALLNTSGEFRMRPADLLSFVNSKLVAQISNEFLTAAYCVYDNHKRELSFARGGHCYPLLIRAADESIEKLKSRGRLLGHFPDLVLEEKRVILEPGDKVLLFTDGLIENFNHSRVQYGDRGLHDFLKKNLWLPVEQLVEELYQDAIAFRGSLDLDDDICIVGLEVEANGRPAG